MNSLPQREPMPLPRAVPASVLHVECELSGDLDVSGTLVIGQSAIVNADVRAVDAVIHGHFEGRLVASGTVEITATGRVLADIRTDSLVIAKGAVFKGNVSSLEPALAPEPQGRAWKVDLVTNRSHTVSDVIAAFKEKRSDDE